LLFHENIKERRQYEDDNISGVLFYCQKRSDCSFRSNVEIYCYLCSHFDCWRYPCV